MVFRKKLIDELKKIGCFVIIRENISQDFGAWKMSFSRTQNLG